MLSPCMYRNIYFVKKNPNIDRSSLPLPVLNCQYSLCKCIRIFLDYQSRPKYTCICTMCNFVSMKFKYWFKLDKRLFLRFKYKLFKKNNFQNLIMVLRSWCRCLNLICRRTHVPLKQHHTCRTRGR